MRRTSTRISAFVEGRPTFRWRDFHVQYLRNPSRCHLMTVAGSTITRTSRHRGHHRRSARQKTRSVPLRRGRGRLLARTASCCRRARFSRMRSAREAKRERNQPPRAAIRVNIGAGWRPVHCQSTVSRRRPWEYHPRDRNPCGFNGDRVVANHRAFSPASRSSRRGPPRSFGRGLESRRTLA